MTRLLVRLLAALALLCGVGVAHSQNASTITNPLNGQVDVAAADTLRWTAVPGALAYYLYVGTTPGAKDLIDTGEFQRLSYPMAGLPTARPLYARLYTKFAASWRFVDVSFSLSAAAVAGFVNPATEDAVLDVRADRISWTTVSGAQAYYLYVGTQVGTKNLIDTGEIQQTSVSIAQLPVGQRLHARLYTKHATGWAYTDRAFTTRPVAYFTNPASNGVELDVRAESIAWTSVPGADAYYLYVGTTAGAKDLIDTGETQLRSVPASSLPIGKTLHARVHTLHGGRWHAVDVTFKTRPVAYFITPGPGAELDVRAERISWTTVPEVQAYFLYVGTTVGAKDLISTGETTKTSVSAATLPIARQVHARLYTKVDNKWRYVDRTFLTRPVAYVGNIAAGATNVDPSQPMSWLAVPDADAYFVNIGSVPGGIDLYNSGEIPRTYSPINMLPGGTPVYVTLHTHWGGKWRSTSTSFTVAPTARLSVPGGLDRLDPNIGTLQWNSVSSAEAYRITIGTASGQSNIFDSGSTAETFARIPSLPGGAQVYIRVWTRVAGQWTYSDAVAATQPIAGFLAPKHGARGVAAPTLFRWTAVAGASGYRLSIGTGQGRSDLFESGIVSGTSTQVTSLGAAPATLYARITTLLSGGTQTHADVAFSTDTQPAQPPQVLMPAEPDGVLDVAYGIEWGADPLVRHYDLAIGSTLGGADVTNVTRLTVNRRLVRGLVSGNQYYGRVTAEMIDGSRLARQFSFVADDGVIDAAATADVAMWATASLRGQASFDNVPMPATLLRRMVSDAGGGEGATCYHYTRALLEYLVEAGATAPARQRDICLQDNSFDCHTLAEMQDESTGSWQILDPTFALIVRRTDDGRQLSAQDMHDSIWMSDGGSGPEYEFLSAAGDAYVRDYYLDYPILFALLLDSNGQVEDPRSVISLYDFVGSSVAGPPSTYALRCVQGADSVRALIDGSDTILACDSPDRLTRAFMAETIAPSAGNTAPLAIYSPRRDQFVH